MMQIPCGSIFHTVEHLTEPKHILAAWLYNLFLWQSFAQIGEVVHSHTKLISDLIIPCRLVKPQLACLLLCSPITKAVGDPAS